MIITLNQSEIEAALTAHINNLMNLKDGVAIKYEFKATRGDEGFTAVLDITDGKAAPAPAPVKVVAAHPAATAKAAAPAPKAEVKEETKPPFTPDTPKGNEETSSKHEEVKQEAAQSSDSQAASTEAAETGTAQAATAEAAPETAAAPAAAKPSLFANLKSPK